MERVDADQHGEVASDLIEPPRVAVAKRTEEAEERLPADLEPHDHVGDLVGADRRAVGVEVGSILNKLAFAYQYDESVPDVTTLRGLYDQLSVPLLRDAANTYLNVKRYVKVVLMPEGNTP